MVRTDLRAAGVAGVRPVLLRARMGGDEVLQRATAPPEESERYPEADRRLEGQRRRYPTMHCQR